MKNYEISLNNINNTTEEGMVHNFKYLLDDLLEILYRQDVALIEDDGSRIYNPKIYKAIKIESA